MHIDYEISEQDFVPATRQPMKIKQRNPP